MKKHTKCEPMFIEFHELAKNKDLKSSTDNIRRCNVMKNIRIKIGIDVQAKDWYKLTKFAEKHGWRFMRTGMFSTNKNIITGWFINKFKNLAEFEKEMELINKFQVSNKNETVYISDFDFTPNNIR